jgi:hypothetical protein
MRAFFDLSKNKILKTSFTAYPSFNVFMSGNLDTFYIESEQSFYLYNSSSWVQGRTFFDVNGNFRTGSFDYSGKIVGFTNQYAASGFLANEKTNSAIRFCQIYASSSFVKTENYNSSSLTFNSSKAIIQIPSALYGSEVKPGSISILGVGANPSTNLLFDDGFGGLWLTGATSILVGSILYQHGIILMGDTAQTNDVYALIASASLTFSGTFKYPMNMYLIDVPKAEANFSTNSSYVAYDTGSQENRLSITQPKTYITAVGLYDENFELAGIIKLATPFYNDEVISGQIRAKLVF